MRLVYKTTPSLKKKLLNNNIRNEIMKNFLLILNVVSVTLILSSYESFEVILKKNLNENEITIGAVLLLAFLLVNLYLYLKGKVGIIKSEFIFLNLLTNFFFGRIFIKIKYSEFRWYDVIYTSKFIEIKRHYNTFELNQALNEYLELQMAPPFNENIKMNIISESKTIKELYSNILLELEKIEAINEANILDFSGYIYVLLSFCASHPLLTVMVTTWILDGLHISYRFW